MWLCVGPQKSQQPVFILRGHRGFVKIPFRIAWGNHYFLCCKWQCLNKGYIMTGDRWWGDLEGKCYSVKGRWDWSLWRGALTDLMEVLSTLASVSHRWCPSTNKDITHLVWIALQRLGCNLQDYRAEGDVAGFILKSKIYNKIKFGGFGLKGQTTDQVKFATFWPYRHELPLILIFNLGYF